MTFTIRSNNRRIRSILRAVVTVIVDEIKQEWEKLEGILMQVLIEFPEAKAAVVAGIREVLGHGYQPEMAT